MIRSNVCNYGDTYILVSGTILISGAGADNAAKRTDERNKGVIFKNCATFTDCISERNNTQIDNAKDIDVVMSMFNLIEYSHNYSKTLGSLWQHYRDEPAAAILNSESFKSKIKVTGKIRAAGNVKNVKMISIPLKSQLPVFLNLLTK